MAEAILEAKAVSKSFPLVRTPLGRRGGVVQAVKDVSLTLSTEDAVGLVGESGCGKTTLAKLLIGLMPPSQGVVEVHGRPWRALAGAEALAARRAVQFVFQDPLNSLNPRLTVEATLEEPLVLHRLARGAERRRRVGELLDMVQLTGDYARRLPRELSGGERQRVGIARALAVEPELLICDEPIASLDLSVAVQILDLLRAIRRRRRMGLLFISHDLRAVAALCERVAVMQEGRLIESAATAELLQRPRERYTETLIRSAALDLDAVSMDVRQET